MVEADFWKMVEEGRIVFGSTGNNNPAIKLFLSEVQGGLVPRTWWPHDEGGHTQEAKRELQAIFPEAVPFATPKPSRLIERILQIATNPGDLVLDSFAGSGTTGHAVLKLNAANPDQPPRRFIMVEVEDKVATEVTRERVRRVAEGYTNAKGETVAGLGGGFRFCELGEPLFDESGHIRETVKFGELARHVYFTETGEPLPRERVPTTPLLGVCRGVAVYLLFNGILGDKTSNGGNVLTRKTLAALPPFDGPKVIYCAGCLIGAERLAEEAITIRQTPYEIRVS
jgi:site-specific DNA-methyltransferase (adenine-specific)/adenine-specific DNA-methyltransferase